MSATATSDPVKESGAASKSKKKNKKKKGAGGGSKADESANTNGDHAKSAPEDDEAEDVVQEKDKPDARQDEVDDVDDGESAVSPQANGNTTTPHSISSAVALGLARSRSQGGISSPPPGDTSARLDALAKERDTLRLEVTELRKSLEEIKEKHEEELSGVNEQLEESNEGKDHFETQYKNLLGRVNTIKTSLGDRLKADSARLDEARQQIEDLEEANKGLQENNNALTEEISKFKQDSETQSSEISTLRGRANLSQQNWVKERDELISREAYAREEFENAKQAMQDWEVLAMDERRLRENLGDRVAELEDQLNTQREGYERAASERDQHNAAVEGLQRALQEVQTARKTERRELVEQAQTQMDELRKQLQVAEEAASTSKQKLETTQKELERALPFEKEVKEKNLLIGKLRHEAVTLNEHLTKALRILKKGKPEDNVDRQIVTNYLLHFLSLDRSDPRKFESLQLIAALLNWTDEQRESAGLARPGASAQSGSLRIPLSPFRRTPSTPSLNSAVNENFMMSGGGSAKENKESLAELWSDFLEREAAEGGSSRRGSQATSTTTGGGGPSGATPPPSGLGIRE